MFIFSDEFRRYDYGGNHPLRVERLTLTQELCRAYGLFDLPGAQIRAAEPCDEKAILRFHDPDYVEALKQGVMYLDIDAHHGDGVQWAFYEEPRVLTVSFHQDGRTLFPGTGHMLETGKGRGLGYSVNVPMLPGTDDAIFWEGFCALVPPLMERFRPDVIVSQLGVDTFLTDPLASLELTTSGFCKVVSFLAEKAPAWVALGGGGYEISNVARAWTLAWAIMNGKDLPDELPDGFMSEFGSQMNTKTLRDPEHESGRREQCERQMTRCIRYLEKNVISEMAT